MLIFRMFLKPELFTEKDKMKIEDHVAWMIFCWFFIVSMVMFIAGIIIINGELK